MLQSDWWMGPHSMRVELKCITMVNGAQCVMMGGAILMPMWYADSLDFHQEDALMTELVLVKDQDQSG